MASAITIEAHRETRRFSHQPLLSNLSDPDQSRWCDLQGGGSRSK